MEKCIRGGEVPKEWKEPLVLIKRIREITAETIEVSG